MTGFGGILPCVRTWTYVVAVGLQRGAVPLYFLAALLCYQGCMDVFRDFFCLFYITVAKVVKEGSLPCIPIGFKFVIRLKICDTFTKCEDSFREFQMRLFTRFEMYG